MIKQFHDSIELKGKHATIMRDGIYLYMPSEIGIDDGRDPNIPVQVMRPASEVIKAKQRFDELKRLPVTIRHPNLFLDHADEKTWTNGQAENPVVTTNGIRTLIDCVVDIKNEGIKDYEAGTKELSCGWSGEFVKADNGPCEFLQLFNDINHIAIVPAGRCGPTCKINDENKIGGKNMTIVDKILNFLKLKKIEVTDEEKKVLDSMFLDEEEEKEKTEDKKKKKKSKDEDPDEEDCNDEDEEEEEKMKDKKKKNKDAAVLDAAVKDAYAKGQKDLRDKYVKSFNDILPILSGLKPSEIKDKTPCEIKSLFIKNVADQEIKDSDPALDAVFNMVFKNYEHPAYKESHNISDENKVNVADSISGLNFNKSNTEVK